MSKWKENGLAKRRMCSGEPKLSEVSRYAVYEVVYIWSGEEGLAVFITDDKLPDDVVRRQYAETKHALCCLNCGFEYGFDPTQPHSIGKPLWILLEHECRSAES
jgi:hypothetical protein